MGLYALSAETGSHLQQWCWFKEVWQERIYSSYNCVNVSLLCIWLNLWKAVKIAHMVLIPPSEKHHDLPGSAFHIKLNHIHWLWPMTDSFTSFHRPYRETTAPINLTSKNVKTHAYRHTHTITHTQSHTHSSRCSWKFTHTKSHKNQHVSESHTNQTQ